LTSVKIFLLLLTTLLAVSFAVPLALAQDGESDDTIVALEEAQNNLNEYIGKIPLQQQIDSMDNEINVLRGKNSKLRIRQQELDENITGQDEKMDKMQQMENDSLVTAFTLLFVFCLAGFISGILFINLVWRRKIKGLER